MGDIDTSFIDAFGENNMMNDSHDGLTESEYNFVKKAKLGTILGPKEEGERLANYYNKHLSPKTPDGKSLYIALPDDNNIWRVISVEQSLKELKDLTIKMNEVHEKVQKLNSSLPRANNTKNEKTIPVIECPYCHGINTKKIGTVNRGIGFTLFGFASSKVGRQWHCNTCGSDF